MSFTYAMSDIHGCLQSFDEALNLVGLSGDNKLVLCGDYIHGGRDNYGVLDRIIELERKFGSDKIIVLAGNHEDMVLRDILFDALMCRIQQIKSGCSRTSSCSA